MSKLIKSRISEALAVATGAPYVRVRIANGFTEKKRLENREVFIDSFFTSVMVWIGCIQREYFF